MKRFAIMRALPLAALIGSAAACAMQAQVPPGQLASAHSAIRSAESAGADRVPRAQLHLNFAREEIQRAQSLAEMGQKDRAVMMLRRARLDAEVALTLAQSENAFDEAQRVVAELDRYEREAGIDTDRSPPLPSGREGTDRPPDDEGTRGGGSS